MTDFRALCAELVNSFNSYHLFVDAETTTAAERAERLNRAISTAVAALAQPPADGEVGELVTALDQLASAAEMYGPAGGADGRALNDAVASARAALARWSSAQPRPPADGEVAELVVELKGYIEQGAPLRLIPSVIQRAADLLERQPQPVVKCLPDGSQVIEPQDRVLLAPQPQPIPVNERLPEAGDCDAEGRCWWFCVEHPGEWPHWIFGNEVFCSPSHWLPCSSLPLPDQE